MPKQSTAKAILSVLLPNEREQYERLEQQLYELRKRMIPIQNKKKLIYYKAVNRLRKLARASAKVQDSNSR